MEKPVVFKNKNGKQLMGIFHLPKGNKKFPLVLFCHGFGDNKTKRKIVRLAKILEKNKIATFRFDFEGCGDSEGDFLKATIQKEIEDLNSAFQYIKKTKNVYLKKIAFAGHSLGAVVCALFLVRNKVDAKTIAMWAPPFNQKALMKYWADSKQMKKWKSQGYLYREGKEKIIGLDYLKENIDKDYSEILKEIKIPILIIHGEKDETVPVKFSKKLAKNYKNIKLILLPKAEHKFEDYFDQKKLVRETVRWFKRELLP